MGYLGCIGFEIKLFEIKDGDTMQPKLIRTHGIHMLMHVRINSSKIRVLDALVDNEITHTEDSVFLTLQCFLPA